MCRYNPEKMLSRRLSKHLHDVTYTRLEKSQIHGVGVVAIRPIPAGVNPFGDTTYMEELVPMTEAEVDGADFTGATLDGANLTGVETGAATGL